MDCRKAAGSSDTEAYAFGTEVDGRPKTQREAIFRS